MDSFRLQDLPVRHYRHIAWDSARWQGLAHRPGDILVCTAYKAGTTWMQMLCALLVFRTPDLPAPLAEISPWLDMRAAPVEVTHTTLAAQDHRRIIKTHTPLDGLPWREDATYICVMRDPRDIFVSMLNHRRNANPDADAMFLEELRAGLVEDHARPSPDDVKACLDLWVSQSSMPWESDGAPYWSVFAHGLSFWQHRDAPNIHLFHYADMKAGLEHQMRRLADILEIAIPEDTWPALVAAAGFDAMKSRADVIAPDTNFRMWKDNRAFFNTGRSGQWRDVLDDDDLARIDALAARYPADFTRWLFHGSAAGDPT